MSSLSAPSVPEPVVAVLLLGSNLGDRYAHLGKARKALVQQCGPIVKVSAIYESAVWGATDQADYLNQAVVVRTTLLPEDLLQACQAIETAAGRERTERWGARTLDVDILFYGSQIIRLPHLTIPHPLLAQRRFVLLPLVEILPQWVHPENGLSIEALFRNCTDMGWVLRVD